MKKFFSISFAALAAMLVGFTACNKSTQPAEVEEPEQNKGVLFVNLAPVDGDETKAVTNDMRGIESVIRSIQVFVFSAETNASLGLVADQIETSKFVSGSSISSTTSGITQGNPISITTYLGKKKIIALVNAPRQEGITTINQLLGRVSNLSENYITETSVGTPSIAREGMVMAGAYDYSYTVAPVASVGNGINITPGELNVTRKYDRKDDTSIYGITIPVYRLGARIELGTVTVNFDDTDLKDRTLTIKDIKLKNVMTAVTLRGDNAGLVGTASNWDMQLATTGANPGTYRAGVADKLQDTGLSIPCAGSGTATAVNKSYIVYPNPSEDPDGLQSAGGASVTTWSPRRTRVVIHGELTGGSAPAENTYYVFTIADPATIKEGQANEGTFSQIVGNRRYVIENINITMKGKPNDDDDMMPATGRVSATIEVKDWSGETLSVYEF